jgi:Rrf2 family protein
VRSSHFEQITYSWSTNTMKLSRTVAYALQATMQLAEKDKTGPIPCSKLASESQMPERFLLQVLRNLVTHGILRSTRGVDGGYSLVRTPSEISVLDVIEAIDGPLNNNEMPEVGLPIESQADLRDTLKEVTRSTRSQLNAVKLSQLVRTTSS